MIRNPEKCLLTSLFPEFQPSIKKCHFSLFNIFVIFSRTKNPANSHKHWACGAIIGYCTPVARTVRSALPCVIFPSVLPCRTGRLLLCSMIQEQKNSVIWKWYPLLYISLPGTFPWRKLRNPDSDRIISITQWESGHRQQVAYHLMHVNFRVKVIRSLICSRILLQMVRLRKNNKAGNPHKHYIFCRTSLFRLRSYKDNFHTKMIKQAIF